MYNSIVIQLRVSSSCHVFICPLFAHVVSNLDIFKQLHFLYLHYKVNELKSKHIYDSSYFLEHVYSIQVRFSDKAVSLIIPLAFLPQNTISFNI